MQSGKRLTLKDYFAKHTRTHKNQSTRIIKIQMLNCYCQLSSSVIFRQYGVSQSECKIDRPRPGLPRVSPRPHTEALGTRLPQFGLTMDQLTLKICELKPRLHNSIIISSSGLCLATVTVRSNLLQRLSKDFTGCAHSLTPLYFLL